MLVGSSNISLQRDFLCKMLIYNRFENSKYRIMKKMRAIPIWVYMLAKKCFAPPAAHGVSSYLLLKEHVFEGFGSETPNWDFWFSGLLFFKCENPYCSSRAPGRCLTESNKKRNGIGQRPEMSVSGRGNYIFAIFPVTSKPILTVIFDQKLIGLLSFEINSLTFFVYSRFRGP